MRVTTVFHHSSVIKELTYVDGDDPYLDIQFNNGGLYRYYNVPIYVVVAMLLAPSKGQYHAYNIKGKYRFARLDN